VSVDRCWWSVVSKDDFDFMALGTNNIHFT
jgi:hypothetical protein